MRNRVILYAVPAALLGLSCAAAGQNRKSQTKSQAFDPTDLSGIWMSHNARGSNFSMGGTVPPMTAWAQARYDAAKPGLGPRGKPLGNDPMMALRSHGFSAHHVLDQLPH